LEEEVAINVSSLSSAFCRGRTNYKELDSELLQCYIAIRETPRNR
jgi:hypothetical protein